MKYEAQKELATFREHKKEALESLKYVSARVFDRRNNNRQDSFEFIEKVLTDLSNNSGIVSSHLERLLIEKEEKLVDAAQQEIFENMKSL
jgi:ribosomal protein S19E (S16A)